MKPPRKGRPTDTLTGLVLDGFEILTHLGEGGMARVFKVRRTTDGQIFALKLLSDARHKVRFEREYAFLAELDHPSIVRVESYGCTADGRLFIVMEYIEGQDLARHLGTPMPWRVAVGIATALLDALAVIHDRELIHRDLTPGNIMLVPRPDGTPQTKLIDFGISFDARAATLTKTGIVVGTAHCVAPERLIEDCPVDARADLYAVGVLLHWMLAGHHPFRGLGQKELLAAHAYRQPDPLPEDPDRPAAIQAIVRTALAKSPADRHPDARAMRAALLATIDGGSTPPGEGGSPPRRTREISMQLERTAATPRVGDPVGPEAGGLYLECVRVAVEAAQGFTAPGLDPAEPRRFIERLRSLQPRLAPRAGGPPCVEWRCPRCRTAHVVALFHLAWLAHCDRCGASLGIEGFSLRAPEGPPPQPEAVFSVSDGRPVIPLDAIQIVLEVDDHPPMPLTGADDRILVAVDGVEAARLRVRNGHSAPVFRRCLQFSGMADRPQSKRAAGAWLAPAESLVFDFPRPGELVRGGEFRVGLTSLGGGPPRRRLVFAPAPHIASVVVRVGERLASAQGRIAAPPGTLVAVTLKSPDPCPPPGHGELTLRRGERSWSVALEAHQVTASRTTWSGLLPEEPALAGNVEAVFTCRFQHTLGAVEASRALEIAAEGEALRSTALIPSDAPGDREPDDAIVTLSTPITTRITAESLRIRRLRIPAEVDLEGEGGAWRVPAVVPGFRHVHALPIENVGERALVLRRGRVVEGRTDLPIPWIELRTASGSWPTVLGPGQASQLELALHPPADIEPSGQPLLLRVDLDVDDVAQRGRMFLPLLEIRRAQVHPAPLVVDVGTTAVRLMTRHRGQVCALRCALSGSSFEAGAGIPSTVRLDGARQEGDRLALRGRVGRPAIDEALQSGGGLHIDVRGAFESDERGRVGGPLDVAPIQLERDGRVEPYLSRSLDVIAFLIEQAVRAIGDRYRLVVRDLVLVHPVGYGDLHLGALYRIARRALPEAHVHLALSDAAALALDAWREARGAQVWVVVDVGARRTTVSRVHVDAAGRTEVSAVHRVPFGGEQLADLLLGALFGPMPERAEVVDPPPSPAARPGGAPWRRQTARRRLFSTPSAEPAHRGSGGPPPPWLRSDGEDRRAVRELSFFREDVTGLREILALRMARVLVQRELAGSDRLDAASPSETVRALVAELPWRDASGERVRPTERELDDLYRRRLPPSARAALTDLLDPLIAQVEQALATAPGARVLLAGRGHLGADVEARLQPLTDRPIARADEHALGRGALLWFDLDHHPPAGCPPDALRFDVVLAESGQRPVVLVPADTPIRGAVGYAPIRRPLISLGVRCDRQPVLHRGVVQLDLGAVARAGEIGLVEGAFPFPAVALKVWLSADHDGGRYELRARPVALDGSAAALEGAVARLRAGAPRLPLRPHPITGHAELEAWLAAEDEPCLAGERPLGPAMAVGDCPVVI